MGIVQPCNLDLRIITTEEYIRKRKWWGKEYDGKSKDIRFLINNPTFIEGNSFDHYLELIEGLMEHEFLLRIGVYDGCWRRFHKDTASSKGLRRIGRIATQDPRKTDHLEAVYTLGEDAGWGARIRFAEHDGNVYGYSLTFTQEQSQLFFPEHKKRLTNFNHGVWAPPYYRCSPRKVV